MILANVLCVAPTIKHELAMIKLQLEAERERGRLREETIEMLKSDKDYLQRELTSKADLMRELVKSGNRSVEPLSSSGDQLYASVAPGLLHEFSHI